MAQNHFKGKYHEGTFANGEGPVRDLHVVHESETKGVLNPSDRDNLHTVGGKGELLAGSPNDKNFDLDSKSYAGPQNLAFKPKNEGEQHPFEVNKNG